jgi:phage-related holin
MLEKLKIYMIHILQVVLVFFSPALAQILIVALAVIVDTITGVWAANKNLEPITSKKLSNVISKTVVYISLILLCHGIEVIFEISHIRTFIAVSLLSMELMSVDENFKKATGNGILKPIIRFIRKK